MNIISKAKNHLINIPGWRADRAIVVFESDDWGAIRTSSNKALEMLRKAGLKVDNCHYMLNDSLASAEDLTLLFEVLNCYKGMDSKHPVITANCLMANPDFDKIRSCVYRNYYWEPFTKTLKRYPAHGKSFELWQQGMEAKLFHPQLHGREHINLSRWMSALQGRDEETLLAFGLGIFGVSGHIGKRKRPSHLAALDGAGTELLYDRSQILKEALNSFYDTFGFKSRSFIAPNYVWDDEIEQTLASAGVDYIQGSAVQRVSKKAEDPLKVKRHFQGQKNNFGQYYLVRNAQFEPSSSPNKDWVSSCLKQIETAFFWKKPAIVETHRVNFIGFLSPQNRDANLKSFNQLLKEIIKRWPEVEFKTSDELGDLIKNGRSNS